MSVASTFEVRIPVTSCWRCGHAIDSEDLYCRRCGTGQGPRLAWYYRPVWIVLLAFTALGPFALPLVWRTPRLSPSAKWITSVVVLAISCYVGWKFLIVSREIGQLLAG